MNRFIVSFARTPSPEEVAGLAQSTKVKVVDRTSTMLLVEGDKAEVTELASQIPNSEVTPEQHYAVVPRRAKLARPA